jgi:two-component sensor histidine kinase
MVCELLLTFFNLPYAPRSLSSVRWRTPTERRGPPVAHQSPLLCAGVQITNKASITLFLRAMRERRGQHEAIPVRCRDAIRTSAVIPGSQSMSTLQNSPAHKTETVSEVSATHGDAPSVISRRSLAQGTLFADELAAERSLRDQAETAESVFRRALEFKEAAIQEANHSVKNTLQMAASLLSLHARVTTSPETRAALLQSHNRLHVLAKAHELLSENANSTQSVPMSTLLQAMVQALGESFAEVSSRVRLRVTCDPIALPADDATALALLANEVMTNAYKHAFPNDSTGELTVDLRRESGGAIVLRIADSGVGIRPGNGGTRGLGLKLIRTFAARLHGTLVITGGNAASGTQLALTIQRDAKRHQ